MDSTNNNTTITTAEEQQLRSPLLPDDANDDNDDASSSPLQNDSSLPSSPWFSRLNPHQITAMLSNYSTSYNVVNISLVLPILQHLYKDTTEEDTAACASSLLAGMILGQLLGGALGDSFIGRLGALRLVMALQIFASIASSLVCILVDHNQEDRTSQLYLRLALWRFILGVGAGGVYPLAAVLSAEQGGGSSDNGGESSSSGNGAKSSVHRVVVTFSTQGAGFVTVPIVAVSLLYLIPQHLEVVWRILLGVGCLPGCVLMIFQYQLYSKSRQQEQQPAMPLEEEPISSLVNQLTEDEAAGAASETPTTSNAAEADGTPAPSDQEADVYFLSDDEEELEEPQPTMGWWEAIRNEPGLCRKILGTAGTWFLFDVVFYGNAIFQPIVVEAAFGGKAGSNDDNGNALDVLRKASLDTLILTSIALPGYAIAATVIGKRVCYIDQSPRYVMLQGFIMMSVLYFIIGVKWSYLKTSPTLLVLLYGMTFFFANYGPNTTTFILPSMIYSPECRSTWNGISAASGKVGAILGATLFEPVADEWGDNVVMFVCSGLSILAVVLTFCFVPKEDGEDESEDDNRVEEHQSSQPLLTTASQDDVAVDGTR